MLDTTVSPTKTDEPIEMPADSGVPKRNHVFGGGSDPKDYRLFGGTPRPIEKYREYPSCAEVIR